MPTSFAGSDKFQYCPSYIQSIKLLQRRISEISLPMACLEPLKRCSSGTLHQQNLRLCILDYSGYVKYQLKSLSLNVCRDCHVSYHHLTAVWFNVCQAILGLGLTSRFCGIIIGSDVSTCLWLNVLKNTCNIILKVAFCALHDKTNIFMQQNTQVKFSL